VVPGPGGGGGGDSAWGFLRSHAEAAAELGSGRTPVGVGEHGFTGSYFRPSDHTAHETNLSLFQEWDQNKKKCLLAEG
jgi:hypothetical protein